jgi:hypothetical protein
MKGMNNIKPVNGIPYCKEHGILYKDKISLVNRYAVVGYAVECKCEEYKKKKG